jgi:serine/threonine-protein kinase
VPQGRAARALMSEKTRTATPVTSTLKVGRSRVWLAVAAVAIAAVGAAVALVVTRGGSPAASTTGSPAEPAAVTELPPATVPEPVMATVPDAAAPPATAADAAPADRNPPRRRDAAAAEPRAPGHLSIRVVPWATILVDGVDAGETPKTLTLPAGRHEIRLQNLELGRTETRSVTIEPGKTADIRLRWSD